MSGGGYKTVRAMYNSWNMGVRYNDLYDHIMD